tara:strand:- start:951 stop:1337 length:387 start_codon:yes stop_codon:yes gene_type:complete
MKQYRKRNASRDRFIKASHILENVIQKNFSKKGFEDSSLLFRWGDIVGKEISEVTRPLKLNISKENKLTTLKIQVNRAYAPQISLSLDQIKAKVNQYFGYRAISEIVLQQRGPYSFKEMNKENNLTKK